MKKLFRPMNGYIVLSPRGIQMLWTTSARKQGAIDNFLSHFTEQDWNVWKKRGYRVEKCRLEPRE